MKFRKEIVESTSVSPRHQKAISTYRRYANIAEDVEITESNIDEWALNEAAFGCNIQKHDLRHILLGEDVSIDQAARELEAQKEEVKDKTDIEEALDEKLKLAQRMHRRGTKNGYPVILIEGEAGIGKTSIVNQWASDNGLHFVNYDIRTASIESFQGIVANHPDPEKSYLVIRKVSEELLLPLSKPDTVLFIDEYNRSKPSVRNALLDLLINHKMAVPVLGDYEEAKKLYSKYGELEENGYLYFPNLLFVVAAQNPPSQRYSGTQELDAAELDRFELFHRNVKNSEVLKFLIKDITADLEADVRDGDEEAAQEDRGRIEIAKTLLSSPDFYFDTTEEMDDLYSDNPSNKYLSPRSFANLLKNSNGTKDDVLKKWTRFCNHSKKNTAETILKNYVDIDDKANSALKQETESDVFAKKDTPGVRLRQLLDKK